MAKPGTIEIPVQLHITGGEWTFTTARAFEMRRLLERITTAQDAGDQLNAIVEASELLDRIKADEAEVNR